MGVLSHSLFTRLIPAWALMWNNPMLLYTFKISIALVIHSLDHRWRFQRLVRGDLYGISIAFAIHSVDHSLSTRLILQNCAKGLLYIDSSCCFA